MSLERLPNGFGQGKRVTTLLTEGGCHFPVISHAPYIERQGKSAPFSAPEKRGLRRHSLHNTTFSLGDQLSADFKTTSQQNFSGSKGLNPVRRPPQCPSMHKSQVLFEHRTQGLHQNSPDWNTDYTKTYVQKDIVPANRLHLVSFENKLKQTEGGDLSRTVYSDPSVPSYWSHYGRIHSKLGLILGPGVPGDYPVRQKYNVITGENEGPAWKDKNERTSGSRKLHAVRKRFAASPLIS